MKLDVHADDVLSVLRIAALAAAAAVPGSREAQLAIRLALALTDVLERRLRGEPITDDEIRLEPWEETVRRMKGGGA